jgi:hypothetical protein
MQLAQLAARRDIDMSSDIFCRVSPDADMSIYSRKLAAWQALNNIFAKSIPMISYAGNTKYSAWLSKVHSQVFLFRKL